MSKMFKSRVGGMMRRTSSVFNVSRPSTPQSDNEPAEPTAQRRSSSSLERGGSIDTKTPPVVGAPSPIAESPARELAALAPDTAVGPSPLSNAARSVTPPPEPQDAPAKSSTGAQLTDEPQDMNEGSTKPQPPENEYEASSAQAADEVPPADTGAPVGKVPEPEEAKPEAPSTDSANEAVNKEPETNLAPQSLETAPEPPAASDRAPSYFDTASRVQAPTPTVAFQRTLSENPWGPEALANEPAETSNPYQTESEDVRRNQDPTLPRKKSDSSSFGDVLGEQDKTIAYRRSNASLRGPTIANAPESRVVQLSRKPSKASVTSSSRGRQDHTRYAPSVGPGEGGQSKAPSVKIPAHDPFADPQPHSAPSNQISREESMAPTETPVFPPERYLYDQQSPVDTRNQVAAMSFPMASFTDLLNNPAPGGYSVDENGTQQNYQQTRSAYLPGDMPKPEFNETAPLLSNGVTPGTRSYVQPSTSSRIPPGVSPHNGNGTTSPAHVLHLNHLGWIEYNLPDASTYYVHPTLRVTTDVDLRKERKLEAVMTYFERKEVNAPPGWEMWLRDTSVATNGFVPLRCWVDHRKKTVVYDGPVAQSGPPDVTKLSENDRLDMEYRYWCFIEGHPAHIALPVNARVEAMDALTWSYTDRLLPAQSIPTSPFSQEECQELMSLLRSFDPQNAGGVQSVVHTRIVSRILLRVAHWHQANFRPNKPLPRDAARNGLRPNRVPFRRTIIDLVVSCLFLGVPLAFSSRQNYHRDHEGGARGPGSLLVIGACTCLVAAIVLSASVTFLSLPGLESVARAAGFVAILCAAASMASALVVVLRCKAEMDGSPPVLTLREGTVLASRRSVFLSLPIVFLAYGTIAFVAGIVVYSIKGITVQNIGFVKLRTDDLARWTIVGSMGGVAGVLATLALVG